MDASVNKEEKSTQNINQVIKEALFKMSDPTPNMTDEERESYHRKLLAKLESGQKLTSQELAFLRTNDPAAYQKARRMEQKRQWLTEQMKKCKSKQEVLDVVNDAIAHVSEKDPNRNAIIATYREALQGVSQNSRLLQTSGYQKGSRGGRKTRQETTICRRH